MAETSLRLSTWGSREAPGAETSTMPPTASAAAWSMPSLTRRARDTTAPSPSPGYSRALLA
nr:MULTISPECIES: hypothetical protein [unclassified Streptosporangium]